MAHFGALWCILVSWRTFCLFISCNSKPMTFEHFEAEPDPGHFGIHVVDARWRTFAHFRARWRTLAHFGARWRTVTQFGAVWRTLAHFGALWRRQTGRQTSRHRQADRQADRQTDREADRLVHFGAFCDVAAVLRVSARARTRWVGRVAKRSVTRSCFVMSCNKAKHEEGRVLLCLATEQNTRFIHFGCLAGWLAG